MRSLRFSIAGLMGVVLLAAIVLAALATHSQSWVVVVALVTRGVLCLALVGAFCRTGAERTWWLGFVSFGWIYLGLPFHFYEFSQGLPTQIILEMLGAIAGVPVDSEAQRSLFLIAHHVCTLLAAVLGGFLAIALFGGAASRPEVSTGSLHPAGQAPRRWWALPSVVLLLGLVLIASMAIACARLDARFWVGSTYLLTWWLLGLTALGALFAHGRRREVWLGAALLGTGFMTVVFDRSPFDEHNPRFFLLPSIQFLEAIRPHFETVVGGFATDPDSVGATQTRIHRALSKRVRMRFPDETTLEEILKYIQEVTRGPDGRIIPIYVDPIGLQEAEKSMTSTVKGVDLEGVRLETSLRLCLKQLELCYLVKDGLLLITSQNDADPLFIAPQNDPYLIVGECLLALIAACLGGAAAPFVCDLARRQREPQAVEPTARAE